MQSFLSRFRKLRNNLCLKTQLMFATFALVIIFEKLNSHVILWWAQTCKAVGSDRGVCGKVASYFCSLSGNFWSSRGDSLESRGLLSMKWTRCSDVFRQTRSNSALAYDAHMNIAVYLDTLPVLLKLMISSSLPSPVSNIAGRNPFGNRG